MRFKTDSHLTGPSLDLHIQFDQEVPNEAVGNMLKESIQKAALAFTDAHDDPDHCPGPDDHRTVKRLREFFHTLTAAQLETLARSKVLTVPQLVLLTDLWETVCPVSAGPRAEAPSPTAGRRRRR